MPPSLFCKSPPALRGWFARQFALLALAKQLAALSLAVAAAGGCAPKNWDSTYDGAYDPFEGANRLVYKFNKGVDFIAFRPLANVYNVLPLVVQTRINMFYDNLSEPSNFVNNALQGGQRGAYSSFMRFLINSSLGLGGLFDPARMIWELEPHETDLGLTLRGYGLRDTVFVMLPFLGPTSLADLAGRAGGVFISPQTYAKEETVRYSLFGLKALGARAAHLETSALAGDIALDEYIFVRDAYEEIRHADAPALNEE